MDSDVLAYLHAEGAVVNSHKIGSISGQVIPASCVGAVRVLRGCGGKQVSGIRCHGVSKKVRGPESEVRSQQVLGCHSTRLPTSDFCTSKMKVTPEISMKKKEGKNRRQVSGARCQEKSPRSGVRSSRTELSFVLGAAILFPVS